MPLERKMAKILYNIVQISDCHLFYDKKQSLLGVKTYESLSAISELIQAKNSSTQIIIASGDVSQDDSEQSYEYFFEILKKTHTKIFAVPGNHDDNALMKKLFKEKNIILDSWQIILLNSQKKGFVEGFLDKEEMIFLKNCLISQPKLSSIIVFHHPPILVLSAWIDKIGLANKNDFWKFIGNFPNVKAVLFGHAHQEFAGKVNNILCYGVPSTCIQFKRNDDNFALDNLPPGYRWIELYDDGSLKTGIQRLDYYPGIFEEDAKGYD
jgi:Icc protein